MAITGNDLLSKHEERKKKKKEESQGSQEGVTGEQLLKKYETHKRYKSTDTSGVDEKYLNTFVSDANSFFSGVGDTSISYTDANSRLQDLGTRYDTIQAYLYQNKDKLDEKSYSSLSSTFDEFKKSYDGVKDFYGQFDTEDSYNAWKSWNDEQTKLKEYDLEAGSGEIEALKASLQTSKELTAQLAEVVKRSKAQGIDASQNAEAADIMKRLEQVGSVPDLENMIAEKEAYLKKAKYAQVSGADDFDLYSKQGAAIENPTGMDANTGFAIRDNQLIRVDDSSVGNIVTFSRDNHDALSRSKDPNSTSIWKGVGETRYKYMTDDEVNIYNYFLAKEGAESANEYLASIDDELLYREANGIYQDKYEGRPLKEVLYGIDAGLDQFKQGVKGFADMALTEVGRATGNAELADKVQVMDDDSLQKQYVAGLVREDLAGDEDGFKIFGSSVGQTAYDLASTTGNMLPSILVGTLTGTPLLGATVMGYGAAGNGYNEMINLGYDQSQARSYGLLVGTAEGVMEYLLGGIGALGGKAAKPFISKIDNVLAKVAINSPGIVQAALSTVTKLGGSAASEALEEGLQTYLEPWIKSLATGEEYEAAGFDEIAYSSLLGALSAGVLEGAPTITSEAVNYGRYTEAGKAMQDVDGGVERLKKLGSTFSADSVAYKLADKVNENTSAYTLGKLLYEEGASLSELNKSDIVKSLERKGVRTQDAETISKWLAAYVEGTALTEEQIDVLENSDVISKTFADVIINKNSTVNQRTGEYAELLTLANEVAKSKADAKAAAKAEKKAQKTTTAQAEPIAVGEEKPSETNSLTETPNASESEISGHESVSVKEIASVKDGEVMVRLDGGEVVNAREANLSTETEGLLYEAVAQMSADPEIRMDAVTANDFVKGYDPKAGVSVGEYIHGFKDAFLYGSYGFAESELERGVFTSRLSEIQRRTAHGHGKMVGQERAAEQQAKIDSTVSKKAAKDSTSGGKKGKVYRDFVATKTLNARQKQSLKALEVVAESLGVDIHVFESAVGEDGKRVGANGWYDSADNSIHIDLYAGASGESTMLFTAAHELTHFIREWSPAKFKIFADFLLEQYGEKGVSVEQLVQRQIEKAKRNGRDIDFDTAYEEVVADSCEAMLTDSNAMEKIALLKAQDKSLWSKIKKFITDLVAKIKEVYKGLNPDSLEANYVREMQDAAEKLYEMWTEALADAGESYQASALVEIDTDTDSVAPMLSERTWTASEYVTEREITAKKISNDLGVDIDTAYKYIDDINSVARLIADDRARLDYEPNLDSTATVIKPNSDYKWSVDMSTLCAKRLLFTGTFDALQKMFPNTAFDSDDIVRLRSMMEERGYEVACGICYVESTRREIGTITADFIERYKEAQKTGKPITRINSEGKVVELKKTKDQMDTTVDKSSDKFFTEKGYIPTLAELNTTDIDLVKKNHPLVYEAYLNFMNARGQAKPKLLETRAEYKGEILKHFKYASAVKSRNNAGGLRLQSFSDFEVPHLIDMMQITMDMARVGLKAQAYTKVPNFAEAFGNTGIKINLSLIAKGTGLDANGNLVFDDVEGINHKEAFRLRDKFSQNVGTILVGKNNAHIIAAMADPRIDYIIPFHKSSWKESLYDALGLTGYDDYTDSQNEKPIDKSRTIKNFDPSEYWDFSKTGDENAQIYLEKCRQDGRIPKFSQFQGYPGYWKLLIDFKMYDNDGVGAPQNVVQPIFDDAVNQKILREYQGGHRSFPVAKDVVEDFAKEYESKVATTSADDVRYSFRDSESGMANDKLSAYDEELTRFIEQRGDYIVDSFEKLENVVNLAFDKPNVKATAYFGIINARTLDKIKNSIPNLPSASKEILFKVGRDYSIATTLDSIRHIVDDKSLTRKDVINYLDRLADTILEFDSVAFNYYTKGKDKVPGLLFKKAFADGTLVSFDLVSHNKRSLVLQTLYMDSADYQKKKSAETLLMQNANSNTSETQVSQTSVDSIAHKSESVKRKFSDRDSYAPTFYSHMGKVVDGIKSEKIGAADVVSYLKGKGVKAEEIKWSGIEAWLEGKKSVTKSELQEFVAGSQLQIEEQMSDRDIELRYDHSTDSYTVIDSTGDVIDTYTYNSDLGGYASENDDEVYEYASDLEKEMRWAHGTENAPQHSQYKIEGGENYRELVFVMPNSSYHNRAMRAHWGEDAAGILAHARMQDITTDDGKKMLFIEEIQSDWHNEGRNEGYSDSRDTAKLETLESRANELFFKVEDLSTKMTGLAGEWETIEKTAEGAKLLKEYREAQAEYERVQDEAIYKIPDAPFRNNYHEYVLKRLIRMAAEEGYDSIGWTTADIQSERWSSDYAESYRIEYDQDMPSFMRKYGKKWGAKVGKTEVAGNGITTYTDEYDTTFKSIRAWVDFETKRISRLEGSDYSKRLTVKEDGNVLSLVDKETGHVFYNKLTVDNGNIEVWSMDIPAAMKNSVLYEGQAMYQDRDPDSVSNRSLLAGALDSVAQNDIERAKLAQYKEKIELIQSEERELHGLREQIKELSFAKGPKDTAKIRSLQNEATRIANRINTFDRQLLTLEASAPLKAVLEREKTLAYKKAEKKGKEALARYKEKAADTQRELMTRYQESRKKGVEGRHKTEMRHKIKDVVSELNQYLLRGTKDHHVPIELQKAVAEALDAVNMDTVGAEERIAKLNLEMMIAKTPEKVQEISRKIDHIKQMGDRMDGKLKALKAAYDKFTDSDDPLIANSHDEVISSKIESVIESVGNTPLRDMTLRQLEDVYDMYRMVLTTVRNANKAFKAQKNESIATLGNRVMMEVDNLGGKKAWRTKAGDSVSKFAWNSYKPVFAFERIGSKTLSRIYNSVRAGEDVWATDVTEAKGFYREQTKKYHYDSWVFNKRYDFRSSSGKEFSLSLDQIMSLYAYSKREQAAEHLRRGGIVFDESTEVTMKTKLGIKVKFNPMEATAYNISDETLYAIIKTLTPEQIAFVDVMQDYLSTTMGAKGNEVSLELYGIKLFKEKHYFPLKSAPQFMAIAKEQQQGTVKIKNSGFSKETVQKASNPIVLTPFMDVWSNHVNEMSMYHAFVLPMEDFYRVYNYKTPTSDTMATESVEMFIQNAYGKGATQYIDQLLKDLNGGARTDPRAGVMTTLIGKFKKSAVFASASVVVQQPSAIARALSLVDAKYFVGKMTLRKHSQAWAEVKKYAPVAIIKEMGYFDTNMGMQTTEWMTTKEYSGFTEKAKALFTDSNFRDEMLSKAPALADEMSWCYIWEAVKRETRATTKLQPGTEEFLAKAGERFTEVVVKTQVYDSVLARSGLMRSKDTGLKMATAFMAEPTTSLNMIADAIVQGKRGKKAYAAKTLGAVAASMILNSILVSFVYAGRDDDEDKTYAEKYIGTLTEELLDSFNPLTLIPFVKDVVSIFQGYDVERSDMAVVTDLVKAWNNLSSDNRSVYRKVEDFAGAIASIFGLPVKNIMRDVRAMYNTVNSFINGEQTTGAGIKNAVTEAVTGKEMSKSEKLYDAMVSGDSAMIDRVESQYKDQDAFEIAVRQALRGEYEEGDLSDSQAVDMLVDYGGKAEDDAIAMVMYWAFKQDNPDTYVDDSWFSEYYADGVADAGIPIETFVDYRNEVKGITGEGKKERRMAVINSLPITNDQKDALYFAEGWTESRLYEAPWH